MWQGKTKKVPWTPERYFSWHKFYDYNSGIHRQPAPHTFLPLMLATGNPEYPRRVACTGTRKVSTTAKSRIRLICWPNSPAASPSASPAPPSTNKAGRILSRGAKAPFISPAPPITSNSNPNAFSRKKLEPEEFSSPLKLADIPRLEKNWFECIRNGGTPLANVDLAMRAHAVLALAENGRTPQSHAALRRKDPHREDRRWPRGQTAQLRHSFARKSRLSAGPRVLVTVRQDPAATLTFALDVHDRDSIPMRTLVLILLSSMAALAATAAEPAFKYFRSDSRESPPQARACQTI